MLNGKLKATTTGFAGFIADLTFDAEVRLVPNPRKTEDKHPKFLIKGSSPAGREIDLGAAWEKRSRADNDFLSLSINVAGQTINCNAVEGDEDGEMVILPFAN